MTVLQNIMKDQLLEALEYLMLGVDCPSCGGMGKDDGGPGSWTCHDCEGKGWLTQSLRSHPERKL